jgi:hypothetical protein
MAEAEVFAAPHSGRIARKTRYFERIADAISSGSILLLDAYLSNAWWHDLLEGVAVVQRKIGDLRPSCPLSFDQSLYGSVGRPRVFRGRGQARAGPQVG